MGRIDIDNDGKFIDLYPLTTREERRTLDDAALDALREERRTAAQEARVERRQFRQERREGRMYDIKAAILRTFMRLGIAVSEDDVKRIVIEVAGRLAKIPDPGNDGWTPDEIAAEARVELVERIDEWARWVEWADKLDHLLDGAGNIFDSVGDFLRSAAVVFEAQDSLLFDAVIGAPVEQYVIVLLTSDEGSDLVFSVKVSSALDESDGPGLVYTA